MFLGSDPDIKCLSMAACDEEGIIKEILVLKNAKGVKGREAVCSFVDMIPNHIFQLACLREQTLLAAAAESQEISYSADQGKNPRSMLTIAPLSGTMLLVAKFGLPEKLYLPAPQKWKGTAKKRVHQARICNRLGWDYEQKADYCHPPKGWDVPVPFMECVNGNINKGDWKHILDSIGLALYARDQYLKDKHKEETLKKIGLR